MLRFFDGFESQTATEWTNQSGIWSLAAAGRLGGNAIDISGPCLSKTIDSQPSWFVGFGFKPPRPDMPGVFAGLMDGGTMQVQLSFANTGTNLVVSNGNGTVLGTAVINYEQGVWHFYELNVVFSATAGSVILKRDGATLLTLTNVNTIHSANATADTLWLTSNNGQCLYDDVYMCDATGTRNNTFLGDCRVTLWVPTQDGVHKDFIPSTGTSHYAMVDDVPSDGDATYVSSGTVGAIDTYRTPAATFAGTVKGLKVGVTARKDDAGNRSVGIVIGDGVDPVTQLGANFALTTVYTRQVTAVMETNPLTGNPWTLADIQADEFGLEVTV